MVSDDKVPVSFDQERAAPVLAAVDPVVDIDVADLAERQIGGIITGSAGGLDLDQIVGNDHAVDHISLRNDNEQHIWVFDGGL